MLSGYTIAIRENQLGVMSFEMSNGIDVVNKSSVKECFKHFGIYPTEEVIKEWVILAHQNRYKADYLGEIITVEI